MMACEGMKVIVCGGRDYNNGAAVFAALDKAHAKRPFCLVVHGASGAGLLSGVWAYERGVMAGEAICGDPMATEPDGVIAFPGAPAALLEKAREAGVKVWMPYGANKEE